MPSDENEAKNEKFELPDNIVLNFTTTKSALTTILVVCEKMKIPESDCNTSGNSH